MRPFVLFLILSACLTTNSVSAQIRFDKIKCDSFKVLVDTSRAILYRRGKVTVFDKRLRKFIMKPTKDFVQYLPEQDVFIIAGKKGMAVTYFNEAGEAFYHQSDNPDAIFVEFPFDQFQMSRINHSLKLNDAYLHFVQSGDSLNADELTYFFPNTYYSLERMPNNTLLVNYNKTPTAYFDEFDGSSKILDEDKQIANSGIYSMASKKWLIPATYESIERDGNKFICLKRTSVTPAFRAYSDPYARIVHSYDIFSYEDGALKRIMADISSNSEMDIAAYCGLDEVLNDFHEMDILTNMYYSVKNGSMGLFQFQLFDQVDFDSIGKANFIHHEVIPPGKKFLRYDPSFDYLMMLDETAENPMSLFSLEMSADLPPKLIRLATCKNELIYTTGIDKLPGLRLDETYFTFQIADDSVMIEKKNRKNKTVRFDTFSTYRNKSFGLSRVNDSLLMVIDFAIDFIDPFDYPLMSEEFPGEDSIILNKETGFYEAVYPPPVPGHERSGMYNLNTNTWLISPYQRLIHERPNGYLIEAVDRIDGYDAGEIFSLMDENGKFRFKDLYSAGSYDYFKPHLAEFLGVNSRDDWYVYPEKSIYLESLGHGINKNELIDKHCAVMLENGAWQIFQPILSQGVIRPQPISNPAEFVHYNPAFDYYFWLDQDSLYLETSNELYAVERLNGKIEFQLVDPEVRERWEIRLINATDTALYEVFKKPNETPAYAAFYIKGNELFVDEAQQFDNITPNLTYLDGFFDSDGYSPEFGYIPRFIKFDTETSYICQLENGVWKKKTPYYSGVQPLMFGYLVSTGSQEEIIDPENYAIESSSGRYIVLDSNFKAIPFLDFHDFDQAEIYDFGVKLCTDNCFFVDNSGTIITTAYWDNFELENDQLKAVRYKDFDEEDWWFDEAEMIDSVQYFPINY